MLDSFSQILIYTILFVSFYLILLFLITLLENKEKLHLAPLNNNFPRVTIIVPCFNEEKNLPKTVNSLLQMDYPKEKLDVMIIDDGSTDNTLKVAKSFEKNPQVRVFRKENGGKYTVLNYGFKLTDAKFIGTLDGDSIAEKNNLKTLMKYFENKEVAAVTSSLKVYQPKTLLGHLQAVEYFAGIFLRKSLCFLNSMYVMPGPLTVFKKETIQKVGEFKRGHQTEDVEITLRLRSKNYKLENALDAHVYTLSPPSFKRLYKQRVRWYQGFIRNVWDYRKQLLEKKKEISFFLPLIFVSSFLTLAVFVLFVSTAFQQTATAFNNFQAIGFDLAGLLDFKFTWFYLNTSPAIFLTVLVLLFTISMIIVSKKISPENSNMKKGILPFLVLFGPLWVIWWVGAFSKVVLKKEVNWPFS